MAKKSTSLYNLNSISKFYQSFSGTDTLAFILFPGCKPIALGSLTTISYSMYRNKKPVINIGRTNINGVTRGSRIFAGTMVFTLINQHWLREVQMELSEGYLRKEDEDYIAEFPELMTDELPLFDIMIVSANEYGNYVSMYIFGIDFTDEAQVISVQDMFTENTFSFIARDLSVFRAGVQTKASARRGHRTTIVSGVRDTRFAKNYYKGASKLEQQRIADYEVIKKLEPKERLFTLNGNTYKVDENLLTRDYAFSRVIYQPAGERLAVGEDVSMLQMLLVATRDAPLNITGVYDQETSNATREAQKYYGYEPNGIADRLLMKTMILDLSQQDKLAVLVVNPYGATVRERPASNAPSNGNIQFNKVCLVTAIVGDEGAIRDYSFENGGFEKNINSIEGNKYYQLASGGYIPVDSAMTYFSGNYIGTKWKTQNNDDILKGTLRYTLASNALYELYGGISTIKHMIEVFQRNNNLDATGNLDGQTFEAIMNAYYLRLYGPILDDGLHIMLAQGEYVIKTETDPKTNETFMDRLGKIKATSDNLLAPRTIKQTVIADYGSGQKAMWHKTKTYESSISCSLDEFVDNLGYSNEYGKNALSCEYYIMPYGFNAYKWKVKFENG